MHKPLLLSLLISLTVTPLLVGTAANAAPTATWLLEEHDGSWLAATAGAESILNSSYSWISEGELDGEGYGTSVDGAGDLDNNGYDDVIIGAPRSSEAVDRAGAAIAFYGGPQGLSDTSNWVSSGNTKGDEYGQSVSAAGNVNGDRENPADDVFDDVIIGAPEYHNGSYHVGAVYGFYGSATGLGASPNWKVIGSQQDSGFGYAVSGAGDVNDDGYDDVLVGAPRHSTDGTLNGTVFAYYGSADGLSTEPDWSYTSPQPGASLGMAISGAGDVNRDGYDDIVVGAPNYDKESSSDGAAYVFLGSDAGLLPEPIELISHWEAAQFGFTVSAAGDLNNDEYDDLLVGAPNANVDFDPDDMDEGLVMLYFGASSDKGSIDKHGTGYPIYGWQEKARFGCSVAGLGDLDSDGYDDFAVGARRYENEKRLEGGTFIYLGRQNWTEDTNTDTYSWSAYGDKADVEFGYAVSGAGNVDGDRNNPDDDPYNDLLIGAPLYRYDEKTIQGRAFLYLGGSSSGSFTIHIPIVQR